MLDEEIDSAPGYLLFRLILGTLFYCSLALLVVAIFNSSGDKKAVSQTTIAFAIAAVIAMGLGFLVVLSWKWSPLSVLGILPLWTVIFTRIVPHTPPWEMGLLYASSIAIAIVIFKDSLPGYKARKCRPQRASSTPPPIKPATSPRPQPVTPKPAPAPAPKPAIIPPQRVTVDLNKIDLSKIVAPNPQPRPKVQTEVKRTPVVKPQPEPRLQPKPKLEPKSEPSIGPAKTLTIVRIPEGNALTASYTPEQSIADIVKDLRNKYGLTMNDLVVIFEAVGGVRREYAHHKLIRELQGEFIQWETQTV